MSRDIWRHVPLLGALSECSGSDHWMAAQETAVLLIFSTVPISLGSLLACLMGGGVSLGTFVAALRDSTKDGELFIYSTALLAPVFWMALKHDPGARKAFPTQLSHMVLISVVNLVAAGVFGVQVSGRQLNVKSALHTSEFLFAFAVLLLYLGSVYHNSTLPPNPAEEFKRGEKSLIRRFKEPEG